MVIGAIKKIKLSELIENIWKNSVPDGKNTVYKDFKRNKLRMATKQQQSQ